MVTRREFLRDGTAAGVAITSAAALAELGCGGASSSRPGDAHAEVGPNEDAATAPAPDQAGSQDLLSDVTPECAETADNILGPYYRAGAPERSDLAGAGAPGTRLSVSGRVMGHGCTTPLAGALLDIWQADDAGHYDNDGLVQPGPDPALYLLRGRIFADDAGSFTFRTIIPGHYLNGAAYRPAHIHVTASAARHRPVTTQLYFEGDPYNDADAFIVPSLIMTITDDRGGGKRALFDFVLRPL